MMTTHLCQSPHKFSWEQIKQCIFGRQRCTDTYVCGGCSRTFETVCCLHLHCMKHNGGGSYYFDHVTNTAFPKFDTRCSGSQCDAEDVEVTWGKKVLTGHPVSINRSDKTKRLVQHEETERVETDFAVSSDGDSYRQTENDISGLGTEHEEATADAVGLDKDFVEETEISKKGKEKGFTVVKVRNIELREDGSITFEMTEDNAHLFQVTANAIINQLKETRKAILESDQELEILVPDGSATDTENSAEQSSTDIDKQMTSEVDKGEEGLTKTHSVVVKTPEQTTQNIDCEEHKPKSRINVVPDVTDTPELKRSTKFNKEDSDLPDTVEEVEEFAGSDSNESNNEKDGSNDVDVGLEEVHEDETSTTLQNLTKTCKKREMIDNLNLTPIDTVHITKLGKKETRTSKTDLEDRQDLNNIIKQNDLLEYPICTRPERKRKLTTKMKESELPDTLKLIKRKRELKSKDEYDSLKPRKRNRKGKTEQSKDDNKSDGIKLRSCDADILKDNVEVGNIEVKQNDDKDGIETSKAKVKMIKSVTDTEKALDESDKIMEYADEKHVKYEEIDDQSFDNDADTDGIKVEIDAVKKNFKKLRRKQRSKRLEAGKVPVYKRNDFECEVCGKVGSMNMIKYHEQMHSNKMPFKCEECGKCFKTAACKRGHLRQHGEKKWKCDQCPAAFFRKQYLEMHMTKHTGELPFMCELCGMKFRMAYIVRRHVNSVHKNIRNYKCDICDKTFFRASTRDEHKKRHLDPYLQCSYCPKKFKADLDLRKHELTHTGEKQFFCPLCNQGFTQIWPYYRHMWKIHNIPKDKAKNMRIKNPDIVYMRNINKDAVKKEPGYVHEFIGKPGCTFDMRKSFSQNIRKNSMEDVDGTSYGGKYVYSKGAGVSTISSEQSDTNAVYTETSSDLTDAIVLDIGADLDTRETIVIQTEDLQNADNQQTGYIVVEDVEGGGNIVIYSEYPQNEMEDVREYASVDNI